MPISHPVMQRVDSVYSGFPLLPIGNFGLMVKGNFCLERPCSSCLRVSSLFVFAFHLCCLFSFLNVVAWLQAEQCYFSPISHFVVHLLCGFGCSYNVSAKIWLRVDVIS